MRSSAPWLGRESGRWIGPVVGAFVAVAILPLPRHRRSTRGRPSRAVWAATRRTRCSRSATWATPGTPTTSISTHAVRRPNRDTVSSTSSSPRWTSRARASCSSSWCGTRTGWRHQSVRRGRPRGNRASALRGQRGRPRLLGVLLLSERFTTQRWTLRVTRWRRLPLPHRLRSDLRPGWRGDTLRVAVQISAGDLPAGNGWCDFDANLATANHCTGSPSLTRDIVQTESCNSCHGVTSDTKLAEHGARTEVEYCVICHNPGLGEADMTHMVHKIHYGANLTKASAITRTSSSRRTSTTARRATAGVESTRTTGPWSRTTRPAARATTTSMSTPGRARSGRPRSTNGFCANCHPAGTWTESHLPVGTVHQGVARSDEAGLYRGGSNGFSIDSLTATR